MILYIFFVFVILLYFIVLYFIFPYILLYLYRLLFVCSAFELPVFNKFELSWLISCEVCPPPYNFWKNWAICIKFGVDIEDGPSCVLHIKRPLSGRGLGHVTRDPIHAHLRVVLWYTGGHRRQPRRGCRGRIPTNILVGGYINGNVPTNIRGGNVVEYEHYSKYCLYCVNYLLFGQLTFY